MSLSDPQHSDKAAMDIINIKETPTTSWKADLQQEMEDLELNHVNRALKLQNKRPTPYERKKAAKKGFSTVSHNINDFSNMIIGNFPIAADFDNPWIFAGAVDQMLVKYKTIGLSMENKQLIVKEIEAIRSDFVKMFETFMKKLGFCCGSVWGSKFIDRWCSCKNQSPIIFVEKKIHDFFPKVYCENCVEENLENCRETHRHDYVEMERFQCIKCQKELHRQCSEGLTANCCKSCDSTPFRYNSTSSTTVATTSPSVNAKSDISNLIQKENCFVKVLLEKKCQFSKPELLENAIEYIKCLKNEQTLHKDDAMNQYLKPSTYLLQIHGLFYSTEDGDILLSAAFCEQHFNRCLIEIFALPSTVPSLKNGTKKELITSFFIELVKLYRNSTKAVHLRVPSDLKGLSAEIFSDLSVKLPKQNIAVKTLKETLANTVSFFQIPCFSNDLRFIEIIHVIHELGFKINDKPPKVRSYLSLKDAARNYIGQLKNELVVNGFSTLKPLENSNEIITEEKISSILSANDLFQAMNEFHLQFSDAQNSCYSTFKILSFFFDPRLELLPKAQSVDSGYSSLNSPTSSTSSINYGYSVNEEKEVTSLEKKHCPSPISLIPAKKLKMKHESFDENASTITTSIEHDENKNTMDSAPILLTSCIQKKYKYSIQNSDVSLNLSSKKEENESCSICIPLPSKGDSVSSTVFVPPSFKGDEKNESMDVDSSTPFDSVVSGYDSEDEFRNVTPCPSSGSWMDDSSSCSVIHEEDDVIRNWSHFSSPSFDEEDDEFRSDSPILLLDNPISSSLPTSEEQQEMRSSTPCSAILKLLPPLYPSQTMPSPLPLPSPVVVVVTDEAEEKEPTIQKPVFAEALINTLAHSAMEFLKPFMTELSTSDNKDS